MSPHRYDPNVDHRKLHELANEFTQQWCRLQAFYLDAAAGFCLVRSRVELNQAEARSLARGTELDSEEFQDTRQFAYADIFSDDFCTSYIHEATHGEVKSRNAPNGDNFVTLGQLCLVSFYDFWNDYLRREYVIAKGHLRRDETDQKVIDTCLRKYATHDLWGDLRRLRQSIVHNRGLATSDVARCKLIHWFKPNDPILITPRYMREILLALLKYRNELFKEQFGELYIRIPRA